MEVANKDVENLRNIGNQPDSPSGTVVHKMQGTPPLQKNREKPPTQATREASGPVSKPRKRCWCCGACQAPTSCPFQKEKGALNFRIIPSGSASAADIEKDRDEWFKAIRFACGDRRDSVAIFGTDDTINKTSMSASEESQPTRESFYQAMRHFQEELERLSLVINNIDERGDATKALIQLQQKARVIETMCSQIRPSSDASFSGISTSVDTESSSHLDQSSTVTLDTGDQSYDELLPPLIKSDRHSLIIGNNWVLHNNSSSGLTNGHSLIVDPPETNGEIQNGYDTHPTNNLEQRTNMIVNGITSCSSGNLSAVFECKCLRSKEVTCKNIHNSNMNAFVNGHEKCPETTAFVNSNQVTANMFLGFAPTRINELPPLPPPPPPILGKLDFMFWGLFLFLFCFVLFLFISLHFFARISSTEHAGLSALMRHLIGFKVLFCIILHRVLP
ncbi:uncharacterized protein LOC119739085 [Patiria miniata]|uniref:Uncharacterized protein n=1 Tax=Patiria miniata TaxID=46514 RepID=A0A914B1H7_PATMI|nr:uncharacterized protein LOC119739085 [Patiria miniata]